MKNATNAHVSSLYFSTRLYFCVSDIVLCVFLCIPRLDCVEQRTRDDHRHEHAHGQDRVGHHSCMGTMYSRPSTSMVVFMPQARVYVLGSSCFTLRSLLRFDLRYEPVVTQVISSSVYGIIGWCVPLFLTILSCCRSKRYCCMHIAVMHDGARIQSPLASQIL